MIDNHMKTGGESLEFKNRAFGMHEINPNCSQVSGYVILYD